tara:strand:+ start:284 stop:1006 length:723 start_codon:yes stop_codon:yes gene_type:complete
MGVAGGANAKTTDTTNLSFIMDAANPVSYTSGATKTYNLMGGQTGSIINNTSYSPEGGGSWHFDGTDDRVDCDTFFNIVGSGSLANYSIELWLKGDSVANYDVAIGSGTTNFNAGGWSILYHNGKLMADGTWGGTGTGRKYPSSNLSEASLESSFHQTVVTYNGSTVEIYVDGELGTLYDAGTVNGGMNANDEQLQFGGTGQASWAEWDGKIADVRVYNKALSAAEVLQNYNNQKGRYGY